MSTKENNTNQGSNALCIDLEPWHCAELVRPHLNGEHYDDQVPEAVAPILELLDKYEVKATFFVLATVAEQYPDLVRSIHEKGHEIAAHGYSHKMPILPSTLGTARSVEGKVMAVELGLGKTLLSIGGNKSSVTLIELFMLPINIASKIWATNAKRGAKK